MFGFFMSLGWLVHMLLLAGAVGWMCRRWQFPRQDWPLVIFVLVWADLVLAAHFASVLNLLNDLMVYITSTALAAWLLFWLIAKKLIF